MPQENFIENPRLLSDHSCLPLVVLLCQIFFFRIGMLFCAEIEMAPDVHGADLSAAEHLQLEFKQLSLSCMDTVHGMAMDHCERYVPDEPPFCSSPSRSSSPDIDTLIDEACEAVFSGTLLNCAALKPAKSKPAKAKNGEVFETEKVSVDEGRHLSTKLHSQTIISDLNDFFHKKKLKQVTLRQEKKLMLMNQDQHLNGKTVKQMGKNGIYHRLTERPLEASGVIFVTPPPPPKKKKNILFVSLGFSELLRRPVISELFFLAFCLPASK